MDDAEWNRYIKEKVKSAIPNNKDNTFQGNIKEKQPGKVDDFNASKIVKRKHTKRYSKEGIL